MALYFFRCEIRHRFHPCPVHLPLVGCPRRPGNFGMVVYRRPEFVFVTAAPRDLAGQGEPKPAVRMIRAVLFP